MDIKQRNADEVAFTLLVQTLADLEPRYGWEAKDLPELKLDDVQLICRMRQDRVANELAGDCRDIVDVTGCGHNAAVLMPALMEGACRKAIFHDVVAECERLAEFNAQERATAAHCRRAGYRMAS